MGPSHRITYLVCSLGASCPTSPFPVTPGRGSGLGNPAGPRGLNRAGVWLPLHKSSLLSHSSSVCLSNTYLSFFLSIHQPSSHLPVSPCVNSSTQRLIRFPQLIHPSLLLAVCPYIQPSGLPTHPFFVSSPSRLAPAPNTAFEPPRSLLTSVPVLPSAPRREAGQRPPQEDPEPRGVSCGAPLPLRQRQS